MNMHIRRIERLTRGDSITIGDTVRKLRKKTGTKSNGAQQLSRLSESKDTLINWMMEVNFDKINCLKSQLKIKTITMMSYKMLRKNIK